MYATKSALALAFTAPNLCWACALASPVTFLTGDHVMQIGLGQISPSASSTRDLGTRLLLIPFRLVSTCVSFPDYSSKSRSCVQSFDIFKANEIELHVTTSELARLCGSFAKEKYYL